MPNISQNWQLTQFFLCKNCSSRVLEKLLFGAQIIIIIIIMNLLCANSMHICSNAHYNELKLKN